jgi:hypothetical protein
MEPTAQPPQLPIKDGRPPDHGTGDGSQKGNVIRGDKRPKGKGK